MKKSSLFLFGILLGTIFVSQQLFSNSMMNSGEDQIEAEQGRTEVKVFPNPSDGRFQLDFEYNGGDKIVAKVFDITGKLVKNITEDLEIGETSVTANVDLESPTSGIYFVRIELGKQLLAKKIIIR
jgi:hypothetical protein